MYSNQYNTDVSSFADSISNKAQTISGATTELNSTLPLLNNLSIEIDDKEKVIVEKQMLEAIKRMDSVKTHVNSIISILEDQIKLKNNEKISYTE